MAGSVAKAIANMPPKPQTSHVERQLNYLAQKRSERAMIARSLLIRYSPIGKLAVRGCERVVFFQGLATINATNMPFASCAIVLAKSRISRMSCPVVCPCSSPAKDQCWAVPCACSGDSPSKPCFPPSTLKSRASLPVHHLSNSRQPA